LMPPICPLRVKLEISQRVMGVLPFYAWHEAGRLSPRRSYELGRNGDKRLADEGDAARDVCCGPVDANGRCRPPASSAGDLQKPSFGFFARIACGLRHQVSRNAEFGVEIRLPERLSVAAVLGWVLLVSACESPSPGVFSPEAGPSSPDCVAVTTRSSSRSTAFATRAYRSGTRTKHGSLGR